MTHDDVAAQGRDGVDGLIGAALIALLLGGLVAVPFGVPGLWIMVGALLLGWLFGSIGGGVLLASAGLAGLAELGEWLLLRNVSMRFGGSPRAFWGAVAGGFLGLFVGLPVPVLGPLLTSLVGTFVGAAVVTYWESREAVAAGRVGTGAVLGRALSVVMKAGAGIVILVLGASAVLV